ncbi:hypothetical protein ACFQ68_00470 [Amycolatopsis japonica]
MSGFAVLNPASGPSALYSVNLLTSAAAKIGDFPLPIGDVAVELDGS